MHPAGALERARHRGWIEYGSAILNNIGRLYNAKTETAFEKEHADLRVRFERLEAELAARDSAPFFDGTRFSLVDAAYGPVFRYFDVFEARAGLHILNALPRIGAWRTALSDRPSVQGAVDPSFPELLARFFVNRDAHISALICVAAGR